MNINVVGGVPNHKQSSVVWKIVDAIKNDRDYSFVNLRVNNGTLPKTIKGNDLVIWMPDIDNEEQKDYPVKDKGSVLICSKVMREGYTLIDAVSRIFKMHGNAVIAIYKNEDRKFRFQLVDALGNIWIDTTRIEDLCRSILDLHGWTKSSIRVSLEKEEYHTIKPLSPAEQKELQNFIDINKKLAYSVAEQCGNRYFGNYSTRCTKLFPSLRGTSDILVSPRNVNKKTIEITDMVPIYKGKYVGERKPSVDTPIQLEIYNEIQDVNCMIHGHAYIKDAITTSHYYPCGDIREVPETIKLIKQGKKTINLKNHGFLIVAKSIEEMGDIVSKLSFKKLQTF
jgi:ribulose-5-phosphate 4-epimerase/fuculose-1-phosphate aldolase